jgi:SAM-dependent methyltransferase
MQHCFVYIVIFAVHSLSMKDTVSWFANWFDTKYYHILYKHRDYSEAAQFVDRLMNRLALPLDAEVLDLACGAGRHALHISQLGYDVTGLDLSPNSIAAARKFQSDSLRFDVHDMREVYPNVSFDAVLNLFTSFGYFDNEDDNSKMLTSVAKMLKKNGVLVIDFMNAKKVIADLVGEEQKEIDGILFHIKRSYDGKHIFKHIEFEDDGRTFSFMERVQAIQLVDFQRLLNAAGFQVDSIFGNYELDEFNVDQSNRLIILARKA